jgi:segregation and condensation protein B
MEDALDKQEDMQAQEATDSASGEQAGLVENPADTDGSETDEFAKPDAFISDIRDADDADDADGPGASAPADAAADREIAATVEAILFSADSPLSAAKIALVAELPGRWQVKQAVAHLNERYDRMGCAFCIEPIAGGYQMLTRPQYHDVVSRLFKNKSDSRLSQAAMETLAIVAYRQPILRADIEAVRGVASGEMLRNLMDKNLVKIVGRAEVLGRPMLYGTTRQFLEVFGLNSIDDLPNVESLRAGRDANANANAKKPAAPTARQADESATEQPAGAEAKAKAQAEAQSQPPQPAAKDAAQPEEPLID